jgi:drug/metabolite transporter (DMT)-like permease
VLVVGWLWARVRQRPRPLTIAGTIAALAGLAMVAGLTGASRISAAGVMWALLAAVTSAAYFVLAATPSDLPPMATAWAGMCTGAVTLAILGAAGAIRLTASTQDVILLNRHVSWLIPVIGLSLFASAVAYTTGIVAARTLGARLGTFLGMTEVPFAVLFAWIALNQLPTATQFTGGVFILAGVTLVRADE